MSTRLAEAISAGRTAVTQNWRPFVLIQACAVLLVAAYYLLPGAPVATAWMAELKQRGGLPFSALTTAFAGAILPEIARRITRRQGKFDGTDLVFQLVFFAFMGVIIDLFYRFLARVIGAGTTPDIVLKKVLVDQLLFGPLVTITISATVFLWKDAGFSFRRTVEASRNGVWVARFVSLVIVCWAFWIPMLVCVYAMPTNLQFCLFLCAQGAWGLLLLAMSGR
ncbi:hypothetical protein [Fimbriimonas ginsengisoli]|uniref:Uncharacterized protein n=1 Tax=Fimbriimonas ginsengisoli Gsoil 348 TaxID=661478 RepID=A0A068NRX4_FIMGI|nr:hypothetical protein [Fimbriimonas ginsengisoli]AIE86308.1 hypothetical protein OP10G_2940 [Fimbriimonas ginsengisoli Gsoil 348]